MSEELKSDELKFRDFAQQWPDAPAPSADLWSRIARRHVARQRRRRHLRIGAAACAAFAALALVVLVPQQRASGTDWQARAQALEIELHAYPPRNGELDNSALREAASRLAQIDGALQAAYDRGAGQNELVDLWKKRSELLSTLLAVRQQRVAVTSI